MEFILWQTLKIIQKQYVEGLITKQEKNLKMISRIVDNCCLVDTRKDKIVFNARTNARESIMKEAKRLGYEETVKDLFSSLKI